GLHDGAVTGLDATVNFQSETDPAGVDTVTGLIQTDVCAEPGDSGGPLFTQEGSAIGLTPGGSGDRTSGGEASFPPVTAALQATGATLGAGGAGDQNAGGAGDQNGGGAGDQNGGGAGDQNGGGAGDQNGGGAGDQNGGGEQAGGDGVGGAADPSASAG